MKYELTDNVSILFPRQVEFVIVKIDTDHFKVRKSDYLMLVLFCKGNQVMLSNKLTELFKPQTPEQA